MIEFPIIYYVFVFLCGIFFIIRNIFYFKLWSYKNKFDNEVQRAKVFGLGIQKFMFPISLDEKASDPLISRTIIIMNIFNYLQILSFILAIISFFNHQNV